MLFVLLPTLFVFGLAFGSFLNAFEYRLFTKRDWVKERSHCPGCKHELGAFDLIPVVSWLLLGGRCRYCGRKVSWQYPVVEFVMGLLFALYGWVVLFQDQSWQIPTVLDIATLIFGLIVIWSLVFFTVYDLKYGLIPDKVLLSLIIITILGYLPFLAEHPLGNALAGLGTGGFFSLIIWLTKGKGMGGGDMKLVLWFGLFFGWPNILWILYLSFVVGGILGVFLLVSKIRKIGQTIPFGPFLTISAFIVLIYGERISQLFSKYIFTVEF